MLKTFRDKVALSGMTVLMIGVALLVFTFISAYSFLAQRLSIIASEDLVQTFGEALAPLIATCIRIMYLGVMGWVGSLLTIRGVTIIAHTPTTPPVIAKKPPAPPQKTVAPPQKTKTEKPHEKIKPEPEREPKPKPKPQEPEFVVIPREPVSQQQTPPKEQQQINNQQ